MAKFRGLPTYPDVKLLMDTIELNVDALITYDELLFLLRLLKRGNRFSTVMSAWRKRIYSEQNVLLVAIPKVGYRVANAPRRVRESVRGTKSAVRKASRAGDVAAKTDHEGLNNEDFCNRIYVIRFSEIIAQAVMLSPKELKLSKAILSGESVMSDKAPAEPDQSED